MPATMTGRERILDNRTLAALERLDCDNPFDPLFIHRSVFGSKMRRFPQMWPTIFMNELRAVNSDVLGWLHMDLSQLDVPVVKQHFDRDYYLEHNFSGEESLHGQVALDFRQDGCLDGRTVTFHAHSMGDRSMFDVLTEMEDQSYFEAHPSVSLFDGESYRSYRWFAGVAYSSDDPWPEQVDFVDDEDFGKWLAHIKLENRLTAPCTPDVHDRVLACCTCASNSGIEQRYALFAVAEGE